jgi:hydroxymethylbilane synthase
VVLAFAGLARLMRDDQSKAQLQPLLANCRLMVLPLIDCPAAPAQGALAIECRTNDHSMRQLLESIHDVTTAELVQTERDLMAEWGGGCHQRFGITAVDVPGVGTVVHHRGKKADDSQVEGITWRGCKARVKGARGWDGFAFRSRSEPILQPLPPLNEAVFIASPKAVWSKEIADTLRGRRLWVSGTSTWFKLAQLGLWVEGCGDGYGFGSMRQTLADPLLQLPSTNGWSVLTHRDGVNTWTDYKAHATYSVSYQMSQEIIDAVKTATHFYWTSYSQYSAYKKYIPIGAQHAVGPGKTKDYIERDGVEVSVFPSHQSWLIWMGAD